MPWKWNGIIGRRIGEGRRNRHDLEWLIRADVFGRSEDESRSLFLDTTTIAHGGPDDPSTTQFGIATWNCYLDLKGFTVSSNQLCGGRLFFTSARRRWREGPAFSSFCLAVTQSLRLACARGDAML
jgi:hypothetical protein